MCGPVETGCEHVAAGTKPEVILADDDNRTTHAMCKVCADWFDEVAVTMDFEDLLATGRVGFVCLHCLKIPEQMPGPGFWLINPDGETYRPQAVN